MFNIKSKSKNNVANIGACFVILCIADSLVSCSRPGDQPRGEVPVSDEIRGYLAQRNIRTLTLIDNTGLVRFVATDGTDVKPCALVDQETGKITKKDPNASECKFSDLTWTHISSIQVVTTEGGKDPMCVSGNYVYPC